MNKYQYYINLVAIILLGLLLYVISDLIDFIPWGDPNRDGLALLIIPIIYMPLFLAFYIIDIYENDKTLKSLISSHFLWMEVLFILFLLLPNYLSNEDMTIFMFLSILVGISYLIYNTYKLSTRNK